MAVEVLKPDQSKLFFIDQFKVLSGQKILIRGASGKGKTTFLHLLAGLFQPHSGKIQIGKNHLEQMSEGQKCALRRSEIGLIFQRLNLLGFLTVEENIQLVETNISVSQILNKLNLNHKAKTLTKTLSLGEQQRVACARALSMNAQLILADEPTSSLDEINGKAVMKSLFDGKHTLIVASHDFRFDDQFDSIIDFSQWTKNAAG